MRTFSPILSYGNVVLEKHWESLKDFFEDEECDGMWWRLTGAQTITFRAGHWLKVIICFSVLMLGNTEAEDEQKLGEKWCRKYKAKNEIICSCSHTVTTQKIKYYSHSPTWIFHKTVRPQILQFLPFHFIFPHTDESLACRKTFLFNRNFLLYRNLLFLLSGVTFFY